MGVPVIGCRCPTCTSTDPRNMRTRASIYVESDDGVRLLIDSGPELRLHGGSVAFRCFPLERHPSSSFMRFRVSVGLI